MAWIMGTANDEEITDLKERGFEVEIVPEKREAAFFGGNRDEDEDHMILVYLDFDARDLVVEGNQTLMREY